MKIHFLILIIFPLVIYSKNEAPASLRPTQMPSQLWIDSIINVPNFKKSKTIELTKKNEITEQKCIPTECQKTPIKLGYWIYALLSSVFIFLFFKLIRNKNALPFLGTKTIKRPDLLPMSYRWHSLKTPTDENAFLWIGFLLFVVWLGAFFMSFCEDGYKDTISDFVAIQASTLALLFPLVILIIDKKDDSFLNIVSSKEVLLHYAWAFPASLALPIISSFYMVEGHKIWSLVLTALSVSISLFVLYRLLKVTFSLKTWKDEEAKILSQKIQLITAEDLADRFSVGALPKQLEKFSPHIVFTPYFSGSLLDGKHNYELMDILSPKNGILSAIGKKQLQSIFDLLKARSTSINNEQRSRFLFTVSPGVKLIKNETRIGVVAIRKNEYDKSVLEKIQKKINSSLKIHPESASSSILFEALFSRLAQAGKSAIESNDLEVLTSLRETYLFIYQEATGILKANSEYLKLSEDPRKTNTFGETNNPFELTVKRIQRLTREAYTIPSATEETLYHVIYFPYHLCFSAIMDNDPVSFNKFISLASYQAYHAFTLKKSVESWGRTTQWLGSILDHYLITDSGTSNTSSTRKSIRYEVLLPTLREFQQLIKYAVDAKLESIAIDAYKATESRLRLFQHDDVDSEILVQESYLKFSSEKDDETRLELLKNKLKLKNEGQFYCWTTLLGICGYILYDIESNTPLLPGEDIRASIFKKFINQLPQTFEEVLQFYFFFQKINTTLTWQWSHWETHPSDQVFHTSTDQNIDRLFAILFKNSAGSISEKFSVSEYTLNPQELFSLNKGGKIREYLERELNETEISLSINSKTDPNSLEKIYAIFSALLENSRLQEKLKVAKQPLAESLINKFKDEIYKSFSASSVLRNKIHVELKKNYATNDNQLGIRQLASREAFIENSNVDFGKFGDVYGQGLAVGEDEMIFKSILESVPDINYKISLNDLFLASEEKKIQLKDMIIVGGYNAFKSILINAENFVPKYKLSSKTDMGEHGFGLFIFKGIEIPVYMIRSRKPDVQSNIILFRPNDIILSLNSEVDGIPQLTIQVLVKDPEALPNLKEEILKLDHEYLRGHDLDTRRKIVSTNVVVEIFENLEIEIPKPNDIFRISIPKQEVAE